MRPSVHAIVATPPIRIPNRLAKTKLGCGSFSLDAVISPLSTRTWFGKIPSVFVATTALLHSFTLLCNVMAPAIVPTANVGTALSIPRPVGISRAFQLDKGNRRGVEAESWYSVPSVSFRPSMSSAGRGRAIKSATASSDGPTVLAAISATVLPVSWATHVFVGCAPTTPPSVARILENAPSKPKPSKFTSLASSSLKPSKSTSFASSSL
mmetsp:Transcript_16622/g.24648  ORF Transcript_16622/g.24648 Transcript_16622/m.24648 type:complete len:210 (+) Transcript_16622:1108-1737(+)